MPTSTATITFPAATKVSKLPVSARKSPSSKSAVATLRSLYPRAARAFLQRDVKLTYSLLLSAFLNLQPPLSSSLDYLSSHRRKWDILRITLEATLYASVPPKETLPPSLQSILLLSPQSLIEIMHARSLQLFTPANQEKPTAEFLPSQILVALVLASVKVDCVHVGREIIENWLSLRNHSIYENNKDGNETQAKEDADGYGKVLEMYSLRVLPRLEDWHSAREFLRYENELSQDRRMYLVQSLQVLHAQHLHLVEVRERQRNINISPSSSRTPTPRPLTGRTPSPSPSVASASTTSTHTVVPISSHPHAISSLTSLTPTPKAQSPTQSRLSLSTAITHRQSRSATPLPSLPSAPQMPVSSVPSPSLLTLLKTTLLPHLTKSKLTFLVVMFLVSMGSFVFRLRRRRIRVLEGSSTALIVSHPCGNAAKEAKKRLRVGWWPEIRKAVADAVQMAAGGLA